MRFSLVVHSSPCSGQSARGALQFARATARAGHRVELVFFFHDGVYNGVKAPALNHAGATLARQWSQFAAEHGARLAVCVTTALRRGVLDEEQARRHGTAAVLHPGFSLAGLGQLLEAAVHSDRLITFGG